MKRWVTLQLSEKGEMTLEEEPCLIENVLKKTLKADYFLPVFYDKKRNYDNKIFLLRGYVFVEYVQQKTGIYFDLINTQYFVGPLIINKRISLLSNNHIKRLKRQLNKLTRPIIRVGDKVKVLDGKYKNMTAKVMEYYAKEKEADLEIQLKCLSIIAPRIPIVCLKNMTEAEKIRNPLQEKIVNLLKKHPKGLTRKQITEKIILDIHEKRRLSTCLSRAVKREILQYRINDKDRFTFFIND